MNAHFIRSDNSALPIRGPEAKIGRRPDNHVVLDNDSVSGYHATLRFLDGRWYLIDNKSRNRTALDGRFIEPDHPELLHDRCTILFGRERVVFTDQPLVDPPRPVGSKRSQPPPPRAVAPAKASSEDEGPTKMLDGAFGVLVRYYRDKPIEFPLTEITTLIGSGHCDIVLEGPTIATEHARVTFLRNGTVRLTNLVSGAERDSIPPPEVAGHVVENSALMTDRCELKIGTYLFQFRLLRQPEFPPARVPWGKIAIGVLAPAIVGLLGLLYFHPDRVLRLLAPSPPTPAVRTTPAPASSVRDEIETMVRRGQYLEASRRIDAAVTGGELELSSEDREQARRTLDLLQRASVAVDTDLKQAYLNARQVDTNSWCGRLAATFVSNTLNTHASRLSALEAKAREQERNRQWDELRATARELRDLTDDTAKLKAASDITLRVEIAVELASLYDRRNQQMDTRYTTHLDILRNSLASIEQRLEGNTELKSELATELANVKAVRGHAEFLDQFFNSFDGASRTLSELERLGNNSTLIPNTYDRRHEIEEKLAVARQLNRATQDEDRLEMELRTGSNEESGSRLAAMGSNLRKMREIFPYPDSRAWSLFTEKEARWRRELTAQIRRIVTEAAALPAPAAEATPNEVISSQLARRAKLHDALMLFPAEARAKAQQRTALTGILSTEEEVELLLQSYNSYQESGNSALGLLREAIASGDQSARSRLPDFLEEIRRNTVPEDFDTPQRISALQSLTRRE